MAFFCKPLHSVTPAILLFVSISALCGVSESERVASAIIIFGDSTLDSGVNNYLETLAKCNFPPYGRDFITKTPTGRFCNGLIVTDYIAEFLELPFPIPYLDPAAEGKAILTGINFASGGAGFYEGTTRNFGGAASLETQLKWLDAYKQKLIGILGKENASNIYSDALFVLSMGSNDYINNYYVNPILQKEYTMQQFNEILLQIYINFVQRLYNSGARKIAVVSFPPLGCLPSQITTFGRGSLDCVKSFNQDAAQMNERVIATTNMLKQNLPNLKLECLDTYTTLLDAAQNPSKYGFTYGNKGCCGTGRFEGAITCNAFSVGTCSDASEYVFFDAYHPSTAMNKILAQKLIKEGLPLLI